jgi:glycosyltransferase involved in cell wall biosynthesis
MDSRIRFSILLATVENRKELFAKLHHELLRQAEGKPVELVIACDNKEISIGKKRQNLLMQAKGDYVAFIDDDDWIAEDYVDCILAALENSPDCVGFEIACTQNGRNPQRAIASIKYPVWTQWKDGYTYNRSIYHKTPHLRSIGLKVGFKDMRYGEDQVYSKGLMQHVRTMSMISKTMYFYRFRSENFAMKYGITKGVPRKHDHKGRPVG